MKTNIFTVAILLLCFTACRKQPLENNTQSAKDNAQMESEYAQIFDAVSDYASRSSKIGKQESTDDLVLPSGAVVTFQDSLFNDGDGVEFTIDYGRLKPTAPKGLACRDGRYRAGKIYVTMDKRWSELPCTATLSIPEGQYYTGNGSDMYELSGTKTITHTATNIYKINVVNAKMKKDAATVSWQATRIITQTKDIPATTWDDEYEITGSASGTNINGESFSIATIHPLKKKIRVGCLTTFVSGKLEIVSGAKFLEINYDAYGNEACDKTAAVTHAGRKYMITVW